MRRLLPALAPVAIIAVAATLAAAGFATLGGAGPTAIEWSLHDAWLRIRPPVTPDPAMVVVTRDAGSEARFGSGPWDRAVFARVVTALARAGATAIGIDVPLEQPSPPGRGGAASDAMLRQAIAAAGVVISPAAPETVSPQPPTPALAGRAGAIGHTVAGPDADGVVRAVPLFVTVADRDVPAFALALAATAAGSSASRQTDHVRVGETTIPVDAQGRLLLGYGASEAQAGPGRVGFGDLWKAVEDRDAEALRRLVDGKIVLMLVEPPRLMLVTPVGTMSEGALQAHLLHAIVARGWLRRAPAPVSVVVTLLLSALTAWLLLRFRWWTGLLAAAALAIGYGAMAVLALPLARLVLPVWMPLCGLTLAAAAAMLWHRLAATHRIRGLEGEIQRVQNQLVAARDALVRQESAVEALEEDLETARSAAARSAGAEQELGRAAEALRAQLAAAQAREERARARLRDVERELSGLRAVDTPAGELGDAELERLRGECERMGIVTRAPAVLAAFKDLEKTARASLPILIVGEPGTGKELFARAAHRLGPRAAMPFVAVNMAAISPELFESELFGHVRGGFTGAVADRKGYFELADRGTIFLDEVGDLRLDHQSKLLRVLQERSFYRVGASRLTTVDVRVVAASNRDLERGVRDGWFREDLYFRLKGMVLRLPPLRERPHDLAVLASRFVGEAAQELGRRDLALSEEALVALQNRQWSGNVRELQHVIRQAAALASGAVITRADLRLDGAAAASDAVTSAPDVVTDAAVLAALQRHRFDMQATARALGWDRSTVTQRLKGLGFRALVEAGGDRSKAALALAGDPALARTVEVKLREYHEHLLRAIDGFDSAEAALRGSRRRFKNLPERHVRFLELLVRQAFARKP